MNPRVAQNFHPFIFTTRFLSDLKEMNFFQTNIKISSIFLQLKLKLLE